MAATTAFGFPKFLSSNLVSTAWSDITSFARVLGGFVVLSTPFSWDSPALISVARRP